MASPSRQAEVDVVDIFLAATKRLKGPHPDWKRGTRGDWEASWDIEEAGGRVRSRLQFRCPRVNRAFPSVSIIFQGQPIWRADLVPASVGKLNPPGAWDLNLPAKVYGSHAHRWDDNRSHVLHEIWSLPYRRPFSPTLRRLSQVYPDLAQQARITIASEQFGFEVPPKSDLFEEQV